MGARKGNQPNNVRHYVSILWSSSIFGWHSRVRWSIPATHSFPSHWIFIPSVDAIHCMHELIMYSNCVRGHGPLNFTMQSISSPASHSHLFPPSLETQSSSLPPPHPLLLPPPHIHNEQYCCQLEVSTHTYIHTNEIFLLQVNSDRCLLSVWVGECSVDRTKIAPHCSPIQLTNGIL